MCYITTQNHGYAINPESLQETDLKVWFINANDKTIEGLKHVNKSVFAVQFSSRSKPWTLRHRFSFRSANEMPRRINYAKV